MLLIDEEKKRHYEEVTNESLEKPKKRSVTLQVNIKQQEIGGFIQFLGIFLKEFFLLV